MSIFKFGSKVGSPPRRPTMLGSDQIPFCTSPSQLEEVTLDPSLSTSVSFAALRSPDKTSPMRGRSVKEFEELLSQLKKENFNLKLRIYFLEERLSSMSGTDEEQLTREVVELKVELEALRKEIDEKEDLLLQASRLVELTDKQHQEQLEEKEDEIKHLRHQLQHLETVKEASDMIQFEDSIVAVAEERRLQLAKLEEQVRQLEESVQKEREHSAEVDEASQELKHQVELLQAQYEERGAQLQEKDVKLSQLLRHLQDKDKDLQAAGEQLDSLKSQMKRSEKSSLSPSKKRQTPEGAEQKVTSPRVQELQSAQVKPKENEELSKKLKKAEEINAKSCRALQSFVKRLGVTTEELEKSRVECKEKDQRIECLNRQLEAWKQKLSETNLNFMPRQGGENFPTAPYIADDEKLWMEIENNNQPVNQLLKDQVVHLELEKQIKTLTENLKQKEHQLSEYETRMSAATTVIKEKDNKILELQDEITDLKENVSSLQEELKSFVKKTKEENESEKDVNMEEGTVHAEDVLKQELDARASEIVRLKVEVKKKNNNLQDLVNKELWSKNREIEKIQHRMNSACEKRDVEIMSLQQEVTARDFQLKILLDKMADLGVHMSLPSTLNLRDAFRDLQGKDLDPASMHDQIKLMLEERMYLSHRVGELEEKLRNTPERDDSHLLPLLRGELAKAKDDAAQAEAWRCEAVDACAILTKRLEELARFLNSLLSRGCFLGGIGRKRRQLLKQAVENSMELSRTINMSICASASDSQLNSMSSCLTSLSYTVSLADMWDDGWLEDCIDESNCNPDSPTNSPSSIFLDETALDDNQNVQLIARLRSEVETLKQELIQRNKEMTQVERECVGTETDLPQEATSNCPAGKESECDVSFASMTFYNSQHKNVSGNQKESSTVELLKSPRRVSPRSSKKQAVLHQLDSRVQLRKSELANRSNQLRRSSSASAVALSQLQLCAENQDGSVSDSEAWSEPDRNVSHARMGLLEGNSKPVSCRSPLRLSFDNSRELEFTDSSDYAAESREATRSPGKQGGRVETELRRLRSRARVLEQVNDSLRSELNTLCRWMTENTKDNNSQRAAGKMDKSTSIECLADGGKATLQVSSQILEQVCCQREKLESLLLHNDAIRHQMEGIMTAMEKSGKREAGEDATKVLENAKMSLERREKAASRSQQLEEELEKARQEMASQQERLQEKDTELLEQQCALLEAQNAGQQSCIELEQAVLELETQLGEARLVAELCRQEEELAHGRAAELELRLQEATRSVEETSRRMEEMKRTFAERESAAKADAERKLREMEQHTDELKADLEKQQQEFERRAQEIQFTAEKSAQEFLKVREEEWGQELAGSAQAREDLERRLDKVNGKVSQLSLQQTRLENDKVHLEQALHRQFAREAELLKDKQRLEEEVADVRHQLDTQVSALTVQKNEMEREIQQLEAVNFELQQQNLSKARHSEVKQYSSNQSEHSSERVFGLFLDKASSRSSGLDMGDFSSLEYGHSATSQVSLPPRLFRQRSEMSDYVSEDQTGDEYGAVITQLCNRKSNVWVTEQLAASNTERSLSRVVNSSPDLGIESDAGRFSSMDIAPVFDTAGDQRVSLQRDYAKLEQENAELKRRLMRTRRTLEETVAQLTVANQRKKQMEKAICKQLCKTHHVLKTTRCHLESAVEDKN